MYNTTIAIEKVKKDDWFKRKPEAKGTYQKDGYCRFNKKYEGTHEEDHCKQIYIKKGTIVFIEKY